MNNVYLRGVLLVFLLTSAASSEVVEQPQTSNPCAAAPYTDFDFWEGEWEVYGQADKSGKLLGTNSISKEQGGCLLTERWTGVSGSTGTSMNFYDGVKKQWVQHWVSPGGVSISYFGGLEKGSMALKGKIFYATQQNNPIRDFKGTWTPLPNGSVRQFFEESTDGGKTWNPWFEGFYFKKK